MYEEITQLEQDIIKVLDKAREKKGIPVAVIVGVLEVVKGITLNDALNPMQTFVPETIVPDDEGPGMTMVEKNLESG